MKNWLTYLVSSALGILFFFMFHTEAWYIPVVSTAVSWLQAFCSVSFLIIMGLTLSAAVSSFLGHKDIGTGVCLTTLLWGLVSGFVLCIVAGLIFLVLPTAPVLPSTANNVKPVFANNFFVVLVAALLLGFALRPTAKVFKDAYSLENSLSEAAFRFCKDFSRFWWIALFFFSAYAAPSLQGNSFTILFPSLVIAAVSVVVVLPLLFCCFTHFKINPFRKMFRLLPPALSALFGQNADAAYIPLYSSERNNLGIQKRVVGFCTPLFRIMGRGGSAAFATYAVCLAIYNSGEAVSLVTVLLVAAACTCVSFAAFSAPGTEVLVICSFAFSLFERKADSIALLPLLAPLSALVDVLISGLGPIIIGKNFNADCEICNWDTV